jgi:hydrogenase nickel incorporation protein HypA/HybF
MHEFSLCSTIVDTALAHMQTHGICAGCLKAVHIRVGAMRQVVEAQMHCAYEALTQDTDARGSVLKITTVPVRIHCNTCGFRGEVESAMVYCPRCQGTDTRLQQGKELILEKLEVYSRDECT